MPRQRRVQLSARFWLRNVRPRRDVRLINNLNGKGDIMVKFIYLAVLVAIVVFGSIRFATASPIRALVPKATKIASGIPATVGKVGDNIGKQCFSIAGLALQKENASAESVVLCDSGLDSFDCGSVADDLVECFGLCHGGSNPKACVVFAL